MKNTSLLLLTLISTYFLQAQTFVESNPFLHWTATSKGLTYTNIEYEISNGSLLSNKVDRNLDIKIIVNSPQGFKKINGEVFFGIGFTIIDTDADTVIYSSEDLYTEEKGVDPGILSNLNLDFTPTLESKNILIKARFFDKKGDGEILLECPFVLSEATESSSNINSFSQMLDDPFYTVKSQTIDCQAAFFSNRNGQIKSLEFINNDGLSFHIPSTVLLWDTYDCNYTLTDSQGKTIVSTKKTFPKSWNGSFTFDFPETLTPQPYLLTCEVENKEGKIGASQWFYFKNEADLTSQQSENFGNVFARIALQKNSNGDSYEANHTIRCANFYAPNSFEVLLANGLIYIEEEKHLEAVNPLEIANKMSPNNIRVIWNLALAYRGDNQIDKAAECYKKLIAANPSDYYTYLSLGWMYNDEEKYAEAIPYLTKAIELNTDSSDVKPYEERILANNALENYKEVIADYTKLLEYSPFYWEYYYKIGYAQIDLLDYKNAILFLTKAIEMNDYNASPVYERGYAYQKLGKYSEAIADYDKTIALEPESVPTKLYLHRGDCYMGLEKKNKEKACEDYRKSVELKIEGAEQKVTENCK